MWTNQKVRNNFRSTITIPDKSWARFRDVINEYVGKMNITSDEKVQGGGGSGSQTGDGGMVIASSSSGGGGSVSSVPSKWGRQRRKEKQNTNQKILSFSTSLKKYKIIKKKMLFTLLRETKRKNQTN